MPELRNWSIYRSYFGSIHAKGEVYGNPLFEDGEIICTSVIRNLDGEKCILTTANTTYTLTSSKEY